MRARAVCTSDSIVFKSRKLASMILPSLGISVFSIMTGLPVALVKVTAMELHRGQPIEWQMWESFLASLQRFS